MSKDQFTIHHPNPDIQRNARRAWRDANPGVVPPWHPPPVSKEADSEELYKWKILAAILAPMI